MAESESEIRKLLPGKTVKLSTKERVEVRPVGFGKLPAFTEQITDLFAKFKGIDFRSLKLDSPEDWRPLLQTASEEIIQIMAFVLGKEREWFDDIDIADGLEILCVIVEQNLTPRAKKNLRGLLDQWNTLLRTPSKPSSQQATAGETSDRTP